MQYIRPNNSIKVYLRILSRNFCCKSSYRLNSIWQEYFPRQSPRWFATCQCPILIGVMKSLVITNESFVEYVPEVLLIDEVLTRTNADFDLELLLNQLILFKEEFDENNRYLVCLCFPEFYATSIRLILVVGFRSKDSFLSRTGSYHQQASLIK